MSSTDHGKAFQHLPPDHPSLAHGVGGNQPPGARGALGIPTTPGAPDTPGTLYVKSVYGGIRRRPGPDAEIVFGRNEDEVHVTLGLDDRNVSRQHGVLRYQAGRWWLSTTGRRNLKVGDKVVLVAGDDPFPLTQGFTRVSLATSEGRTHTLELFVVGDDGTGSRPIPDLPTIDEETYLLDRRERLVVVATAQPYLLQEENPAPWSREAVANLLRDVDPAGEWSKPKVGHVLDHVRERLARRGVTGLTAKEVGRPVGNQLKHNLIVKLMDTGTITRRDLALLD